MSTVLHVAAMLFCWLMGVMTGFMLGWRHRERVEKWPKIQVRPAPEEGR